MNVQEFDTALSDLETRVDRLRALYENWFRGYEKMEPQVARKDVERRVYGLRKELPRNTALRFRYHQLYQRYTTLATYWQRTARQIEEGTYRLQLQRMKRRRVGDDDRRTNLPPQRAENDEATEQPSYELQLDESLDVHSLLDELDLDQIARSIDIPGPFSVPPLRGSLPATAHEGRAGREPSLQPPQHAVPAPPPGMTSARFARPSVANEVPNAQALGAAATSPSTPGSPAASGARPSLPNKPPPLKIPLPTQPGTMSLPAPSMSIRPGTGALPGLPPPPRPSTAPGLPNAGGPYTQAPNAPRPSLAAPSRGVTVQPPAASSASGGPAPAVGSGPPSGQPRPPLSSPRPAPPARADGTGAASGGFSEQRLRRLYDEYAAARRKNNEGDVRYETLASTIQKMLPDLSKKHHGKQIDFEVVLKDGRVGLKPRAT